MKLIGRFDQSGMGISEFARREKISVATLRYWINKARSKEQKRESENPFTEITVNPAYSSNQIVITYPNGVRIEVPVG